MPVVGSRAAAAAAVAQRVYAAADTRFTESARSGDLGYTWGTYAIGARGRGAREEGFYVRVWERERNGQWKLALDALQPQ
jgi:ketosteroid isomerase-like protein